MQIVRMHELLGAIILLLGLIALSLAKADAMSSKSDMNWWKNDVIYHINPQSVIPINNVQDILSKLLYLKEADITTLWLNANVIDFLNLSKSFGSMEDFQKLLNQAKILDMKIIIDLIFSYTTDKCKWFLKSVNRMEYYTNFYIWSNIEIKKNMPLDSIWLWHPKRQQFYVSRNNGQQPELNFREPHLIQAIDEALIFWLHKGIHGFRIDNLTRYISIKESNNLLHHWSELLNNYTKNYLGPERVIIISDNIDWKSFISYYENDHGIRGAHIPLNFLLINHLNGNFDARDLIYTIHKWLIYTPLQQIPNWLMCDCWFDPSTFNQFHFDSMQMIFLTLPGISVIYNGEECYKKLSKHYALTGNNFKDFSSSKQCISSQFHLNKNSTESPNSYKTLIALKKHLVMRKGHFEYAIPNRWILAIRSSLIFRDTNLTLMGHEGIVLQTLLYEGISRKSLKAERRDLIKIFMKSLNIVLVGMLLYKLWRNKWTKLNFYKENIW